MKASVLIATYNNHSVLYNALHSLARQKTNFPIEYCIVDDHSDIDSESIIREFFPDAKYKRLSERTGFEYSQSYCYDLVSPDSDVIVMQAADVIYTADNILEELCKGIGIGTFTLAEVVDMVIEPDMYKNFDEEISNILENWDSYVEWRWVWFINDIDRTRRFKSQTKYTGKNYKGEDLSWRFFAGDIDREDLEDIGFYPALFVKVVVA